MIPELYFVSIIIVCIILYALWVYINRKSTNKLISLIKAAYVRNNPTRSVISLTITEQTSTSVTCSITSALTSDLIASANSINTSGQITQQAPQITSILTYTLSTTPCKLIDTSCISVGT